jgi:hypothetical protein
MIVTVCGSSRFKKEILAVARDLAIQGNTVLVPTVFHHMEEEELPREVLLQLDNSHKEKIEMSDAIFVVNINKYIGEGTYSDIDWAQRKKKQIYFLEQMEQPKQENAVESEPEVEEPAAVEEVNNENN